MSDFRPVTRNYKGAVISSEKCTYPTYSTDFHGVYITGVDKLRLIKKMIDVIIKEQGE